MTSLTYVNECFHDFMFVNRAHPPPPPPPPRPASVNLVLSTVESLAKSLLHYSWTIRTIRRLFADYSYYSSTIRGLFADYSYYSSTIRTIRRLFADYSYYSSTIRTIRTIRFTILVLSIAKLNYSSIKVSLISRRIPAISPFCRYPSTFWSALILTNQITIQRSS